MVLDTITRLTLENPLVFHIIVILLSLAIMVKSADLCVYSITRYAKKLGISDYLVGLFVVALAASMPDLVASITGAVLDESGIVLGVMFGGNIVEFTFVLGVLAIFARKMKMECKILEKTKLDIFILMMIPFILIIDGTLSRVDGIVLLIAFFSYLALLWKKEGEAGRIKKDVKLKGLYKDSIIFIGSLIAMILSSRWLVFSSINLSHDLGISSYFIALAVIGLGAQIPDLAIGIRAIARGHQDVGFGDILGSCITKALFFLGLIAVIKPITFEPSIIYTAIIFTALGLGMTLIFMRNREIDWKKGVALLIIFTAYILIEYVLHGTAPV